MHLRELSAGMPGLSPVRGGMMAEAAAVCLNHFDHISGCAISVTGQNQTIETLEWDTVTQQHIATYADLPEATEHGAYGLAILQAINATGMTVIERSPKGPGFDYWLGVDTGNEDDLPFQGSVRLEVSGILGGSESQVRARAKMKLAQVAPSNHIAPARVVIVEFSAPSIRVETV